MKNLNISMITLVVGCMFSVGAMAEGMSKDQYKASEKSLEAEYKVDKAKCDVLAGNAGDICVAEAKGKKHIAKAELKAKYKPGTQSDYDERIAKAEAACSIAMEKCDAKAGNDKDVCVKQAESTKAHAISDAKSHMKSSQVETNEKLVDWNTKGLNKGTSNDRGKIRAM